MKRALAFTGVGLTFVTLWIAPHSGADPEDLEPYCDSGITPTTGECLPRPDSPSVDDAPGADPNIPLGVDPESVPVI